MTSLSSPKFLNGFETNSSLSGSDFALEATETESGVLITAVDTEISSSSSGMSSGEGRKIRNRSAEGADSLTEVVLTGFA